MVFLGRQTSVLFVGRSSTGTFVGLGLEVEGLDTFYLRTVHIRWARRHKSNGVGLG